jgi:hypothetical protein
MHLTFSLRSDSRQPVLLALKATWQLLCTVSAAFTAFVLPQAVRQTLSFVTLIWRSTVGLTG